MCFAYGGTVAVERLIHIDALTVKYDRSTFNIHDKWNHSGDTKLHAQCTYKREKSKDRDSVKKRERATVTTVRWEMFNQSRE